MSGGLESRCVGRVYGADGAVHPSRAQAERGRKSSQPVHQTATYRCEDTRGCVMQF